MGLPERLPAGESGKAKKKGGIRVIGTNIRGCRNTKCRNLGRQGRAVMI